MKKKMKRRYISSNEIHERQTKNNQEKCNIATPPKAKEWLGKYQINFNLVGLVKKHKSGIVFLVVIQWDKWNCENQPAL